MSKHTPVAHLQIGGKYNWRNQPERLAYMGKKRYLGDGRSWHQFEKLEAPGIVWCEVLDADLVHFEESAGAKATQSTPQEGAKP